MFTNVPGFIKPVYYGGQRTKRFFNMVSGTGNLCTGIAIISVEKRFCVTVSSDDTQIKDTKAFTEMFNEQIRELGIAYDKNEEGDD